MSNSTAVVKKASKVSGKKEGTGFKFVVKFEQESTGMKFGLGTETSGIFINVVSDGAWETEQEALDFLEIMFNDPDFRAEVIVQTGSNAEKGRAVVANLLKRKA